MKENDVVEFTRNSKWIEVELSASVSIKEGERGVIKRIVDNEKGCIVELSRPVPDNFKLFVSFDCIKKVETQQLKANDVTLDINPKLGIK